MHPRSVYLFVAKISFVFCLFLSPNLFAANVPPPIGSWVCKVGNRTYNDWTATNTYGTAPNRLFQFSSTGNWTDLQPGSGNPLASQYACATFTVPSNNEGCYIGNYPGTTGIRGYFPAYTTPCPIDNEIIILCLGALLFLTYLHFNKKSYVKIGA